jgi:hypothetical protein
MLLASCTDQDEPEVPEVPRGTEQPTDGAEATEAVDPTADPTDVDVPFECGDLLTAGRVVQIAQTSIEGETRRVYNDEFLESSGRTGRLTCQYGVPTADATASPTPSDEEQVPAVEIAVSSYIDSETAAGRIDATLGSTSRDVDPQTIGGNEGYLLTGDDDVTFIAAEGVRTYVISLRRGLVPEAAEVVVILELAAEMLDVPAPTPTPET